MTRSAMLLILMLCFCSAAAAQGSVTFGWDYDAPRPTAFEMRLAPTAGGVPAITVDCGPSPSNLCTVPNIPAGTFYARAYAYNQGVPAALKNYSDSSNEVMLTMPSKPAGPSNMGPRSGSVAMLIEVPEDSVVKIALSFDKKPEP